MRSAGNFNPEWGYLAPAPSFMRTLRVVLVATAVGATAGAAVVISLIDRPAGTVDRTASATAHAIVTSVQAAPAAAAAPVKVTASLPEAAKPAVAKPAPAVAAVSAPAPMQSAASEPAPAKSVAVAAAPAEQQPAAAAPIAAQAATPAAPEEAAPPPVRAAAIAPPPQASLPAAAAPEISADHDAVAPKSASGIAALSYAAPSADDDHAADFSDQGLLRPETAEKKRHHTAAAYAANSKDRPAPNLGAFLRRIFSPHPAGSSYYPNR